MWGFNYVGSIPSSIQKSVLRLVIKLFLGGFVDAEVLDVENFVVFGNEISISLSNVQLQKERLQKIQSMGIQAKSGLVESLKFSIAWKDIFSGALSIVVDGIHVDLELVPGEDGLEKSIWYDALSESIHETVASLSDLERVLDAEVAELMSSEEEEMAKSISSDGTEGSDMMRTIIKAMVKDISVEATNIQARLRIPKRGTVMAVIGRVVLLDETEDIRATEVETDDPSNLIYIAKTFQMFDFEINLESSNGDVWPFVKISPAQEDQSCLDFSTKLYKDRNCEVEGWADQIHLFVSPEYVDFASDLFSFASRQKPTVQADDSDTRSILKFGFIKVEIGNLCLLMTDRPFTEADYFGLKIALTDSIMTRFDSNSHAVPTTLNCSEYKIAKLDSGQESIMCEGRQVDSIKIVVDRGNLQLQVADEIAVIVDQKFVCLLKTFQRAFDRKHIGKAKQQKAEGEPSSVMPIVAQLSSLRVSFEADLFPDCPGTSLLIDGLLATICGAASSLSLQRAELSFNDSTISLDPTTLTRRLNIDTTEGPSSLSPFDEMYTMIEDERFLNVAKTEKMQELQELLQVTVHQSVAVSCRGIKVSVSTDDLLSLKAASKLIRRPAGLEQPERKPSKCLKVICALIDLELKFAESTRKLILSDAVGFVCKGMKENPEQKIFDFRSDLVSYSRDNQLLLRRILNLSLDNSFKNIVAAVRHGAGEVDMVVQISGLECKLPLKIKFDEEKELLSKLTSSSEPSSQSAPHMNTFVSLYKCSLTPEFPKNWPRCFPSALFADNIRAVLKSRTELKCFISDGILFLARRHKTPPIPGIYEEGLTYWRDHGYAPVCRLDFLKMKVTMENAGAGPVLVDLENQMVEVEVREDSAHIAKHFFDYISNMGRYDAVIEASKQPVAPVRRTEAQPCLRKDLQDIDEFMFAQSLSPAKAIGLQDDGLVDVEEDFFKASSTFSDEDAVEGVFASISPEAQWESSLEVPASTSHGDETLVVGSEETPALIFGQECPPVDVVHTMEGISQLEIDEDYFAKPLQPRDTFPFSSKELPEHLTLRTRLYDFSVKLALVEGSHFKAGSDVPNRFQQEHHYVGSPLSPSASAAPSVLKSLKSQYKSSYKEDFSKNSSPSSYSKWSALPPIPAKVQGKPDSVILSLERINCEVDWTRSEEIGSNLSALRLAVPSIEVIDQVKRSRWKTVLAKKLEKEEQTPLEDGSTFDTMLRCELSSVDADPDLKEPSSLEYRLKVRLLPLQVHLDQDTLLFLTKFATSRGKSSPPKEDSSEEDSAIAGAPLIEPLFFQHCDIGEISLRIDYKPKKLSFRNIRLGNFAEFVNFFQLEGAELKLPAASLRGVKGTEHFVAELMQAWLPFIKNTQVPHMIKGIAPVRTAINLGQGVSDLILLPMNEYTREGRVLRGLKKGAASFAHSTVLETARLGARLAAGTQVILEQVDDIFEGDDNDSLDAALAPSKYQNQPENIQEGLVSAYQSVSAGLSQAMQTIIAVPIKVYELSGPGGAVKAVIRAVPVAVLKPVIGATEAVSKTLMGVENSLDPSRGIQIKRKYKKPDL